MGWITKRRVGGALLFVAAGIANAVFGWGIGRMLDDVVTSIPEWRSWPWGALFSVALMVAGLALVLWPSPKGPSKAHKLLISADKAVAKFTVARSGYRTTTPNYDEANLVGESALVTFSKAGLIVPKLSGDDQTKAMQLETYLRTLLPLLREGHLKEAKEKAKAIVPALEDQG